MKAITFLGIARYSQTTYVYGDQSYETDLFPEALYRFIQPDELLVFVTNKAREMYLDRLREKLAGLIALHPVSIPEGRNEDELWQIFDALTGAVDEGDEVIFDITHSYRSLPFLVFLAAAYLKAAKRVRLHAVLYGAYEARDTDSNRSPVFDLTPFVALLDWLTATDQFIQTGDARRLAELLNPASKGKGTAARASRTLSEVSLAAFLCQPFQLMSKVGRLKPDLLRAEPELAQMARPFGVLRDQIVGTFGAFGADFDHDVPGGLQAQLRLIKWYHSNNQLIQAMTLAREWLISAVTYRLGKPIDLGLEARGQTEQAITGLVKVGHEAIAYSNLNEDGQKIYDWEERDDLIALWNALGPVRNALDHAGYQQDAMKIKTIVKKANDEVMPRLQSLAQRWGLT